MAFFCDTNNHYQGCPFYWKGFFYIIFFLEKSLTEIEKKMKNICSSFQKLKIIYIMEYLLKNSDEDHAVTTSQIIAYLKSHDITAERKTIYSDIEALRDFGLDIIQVSEGNNHGYYVASPGL